MKKVLLGLILIGIIWSFGLPTIAAKPDVSIQAYQTDVLSYTKQEWRQYLADPEFYEYMNIKEYYKTIEFQNGFECTGSTSYFTDVVFKILYWQTYEITRYTYRTW